MDDTGLEQPPDFPTISPIIPESGANSGALDDDSATLAAGETHRRPINEPAPGCVADPLLKRFLTAWNRLSDEDRLRLINEAERLADGP